MSTLEKPTRVRILEAALSLLEIGSAEGGRMADIAKAAGISRQALYLHFPTRTALLIAATRHVDAIQGIDARLSASRAAPTGLARLDAFIEAWGGYIPEIYGVAKALLALKDQDEAAALAWADRMDAVREGCAAAVEALARDGVLAPDRTPQEAVDILWTLLSVRAWEQFTLACGWSPETYLREMKRLARSALTRSEAPPQTVSG